MQRNTVKLAHRSGRQRLIVVACAAELLLLPAAYGQSDRCAVEESDGSQLCLAEVLRVPLQTNAACDSEGKEAIAEREELAAENRDKQAARVRLADARMNDAESTTPGNHTNLEENFTAARARDAETIASEKELRVSEPPDLCAPNGPPLMPLTSEDSVDLAFRAPPSCLRTLQRARGGNLPVVIQSVGSSPPRLLVAHLMEVSTIIEGDTSMVQAQATIDRPSIELLDDDQVFVRLRCNEN